LHQRIGKQGRSSHLLKKYFLPASEKKKTLLLEGIQKKGLIFPVVLIQWLAQKILGHCSNFDLISFVFTLKMIKKVFCLFLSKIPIYSTLWGFFFSKKKPL